MVASSRCQSIARGGGGGLSALGLAILAVELRERWQEPPSSRREALSSSGQDPATSSGQRAVPTGSQQKRSPATSRGTTRLVGGQKKQDAITRLCNKLIVPEHRQRWEAALRSEKVQRRVAWSEQAFPALRFADGDWLGRLCFVSAFFREGFWGFGILSDENVQQYVEVCREVFPSLPEEAQERLWAAHRRGELPQQLWDRRSGPPDVGYRSCAAAWDVKSEADLGDKRHVFARRGIRPLQERRIPAAEVGAAFSRSEVARFNAREVLPARLFNLSLLGISELHADVASETPFNTGDWFRGRMKCHEPLMRLTRHFPEWGSRSEVVHLAIRGLIPWMLEEECPPGMNLSQAAQQAARFPRESIPWSSLEAHSPEAFRLFRARAESGSIFRQSAVNVHRLAEFARATKEAERIFGVSGVVERTFGYLRTGASPQYTHTDIHDNVLMQLVGDVDVVLFPANCSKLVAVPDGHNVQVGVLDWLTQGLPRGQTHAPFFHVRLRPGDGVVIPSGAHHKVTSRDPHRVGVNLFFEPKFGRMQWPGAPAHMYTRNSRDQLAMRSLWARSTVRLWESRRLGMYFHTARLELI